MSAKSSALKRFRLSLIIFFIALMLPFRVNAQSSSDCGFDLTQASALMTQAQTKAASGEMPAALALLDQATQALDAIKARCDTSITGIVLFEQFKESNGKFTMNYPKGWLSEVLPGSGSSDASEGSPVLFANDPAAFDVIANNKSDPKALGIIVYVGGAVQSIRELGAFKADKTYEPMNASTLLEAIIAGQPTSGGTFGTVEQGDPIGKHETADASLTITDSKTSTVIARGTALTIQIADDQFAVLISFGPLGQQDALAKLARTIAATIQIKAS